MDFINSILFPFIVGLLILLAQIIISKKEKAKEKTQQSIVGKNNLKVLSQDFLYQYEPEKITIEKLIEDFGHPHKRSKLEEYEYLFFEFQNAKLIVTNSTEFNTVIALTVLSKHDKKNPISCRLSFAEEDQILGKAKISGEILDNQFIFESNELQIGYQTIIGTRNSYRQTRHLHYFYVIDGKFDNIEDTKNEPITQVCVTSNSFVYPFFGFYDSFYN